MIRVLEMLPDIEMSTSPDPGLSSRSELDNSINDTVGRAFATTQDQLNVKFDELERSRKYDRRCLSRVWFNVFTIYWPRLDSRRNNWFRPRVLLLHILTEMLDTKALLKKRTRRQAKFQASSLSVHAASFLLKPCLEFRDDHDHEVD